MRAIGVAWGYDQSVELLVEGAMFIAQDFDHLTEALVPMAAV